MNSINLWPLQNCFYLMEAQAPLLPIAVTLKLCCASGTLLWQPSQVYSHALYVFMSHHSEVHQKMSECHLSHHFLCSVLVTQTFLGRLYF